MVSCPIVFQMLWTSLLLYSHKIQASSQCKWCVLTSAFGMFWLKQAAVCSAESKHIMLCRLHGRFESKLMIRNHSTAAAQGLFISDVNFNSSCFFHNHQLCFLQVWCPTVLAIVLASSGHYVQLKVGLQDTLSYTVVQKMRNTGLRLVAYLTVEDGTICE